MSVQHRASILVMTMQSICIAVCCATDTADDKAALCGPLSANFVIQYYRGSSNLVEVVEHCVSKDSEKPVSLMQIKDCLQRNGISSSAVRLPLRSKYFTKTPMILHTQTNGGHFAVLLLSSNGTMADVYEPAVGVVTKSWESVNEEMPDYALVTIDSDSPTENELILVELQCESWGAQATLSTIGLCLIAVGVTCRLYSSRWGKRILFRST